VVTVPELVAVLGTCAGRGAQEIADRLRAAVLDGVAAEPRDDIAVLVLRLGEPAKAPALR
jgi:hypothetical protein